MYFLVQFCLFLISSRHLLIKDEPSFRDKNFNNNKKGGGRKPYFETCDLMETLSIVVVVYHGGIVGNGHR